MPKRYYLVVAAVLLATLGLVSCSGRKTKPDEQAQQERVKSVELAQLNGKKVALVEIDGEPTARTVTEIALVNQLEQRGSFELISKQMTEAAKREPSQDPMDWMGIARRAGADFALRAKVLKFDAVEHKGYSDEEVEDSELEAETGNGKTQRIYPVKSLEGNVAVSLEFVDLETNESQSGIAESSQIVSAEAKTSAAHLPPKLRFLEQIANEAFKKFFESH